MIEKDKKQASGETEDEIIFFSEAEKDDKKWSLAKFRKWLLEQPLIEDESDPTEYPKK